MNSENDNLKNRFKSRIGPYIMGFLISLFLITGLCLIFYNFFLKAPYPREPVENVEIESLIHISSQEEIQETREKLIEYIWGTKGIPERMPDQVEIDINDEQYNGMSDLARIDRLTINMENGINSIAYMFHPLNPGNQLIIYHQGHNGGFDLGKSYIQRFLNHGLTVIAFSMPLHGMNSQPTILIPELGPISLVEHDRLKFLDYPFHYFLEPISTTLNYIELNFSFEYIAMTGISGGGWTTTLYAAVDPMVSHTYPVAGSLPLYLRGSGSEWGDFEQTDPELYTIANYLDLYLLGAANGEQVQILNKNDPCCFGGTRHIVYEKIIHEKAQTLDGEFSIFHDDSHRKHEISNEALTLIIEKLESIQSD